MSSVVRLARICFARNLRVVFREPVRSRVPAVLHGGQGHLRDCYAVLKKGVGRAPVLVRQVESAAASALSASGGGLAFTGG